MKLSDCKSFEDLKKFCEGRKLFYYIDFGSVQSIWSKDVHFVAGKDNDRFLWGRDDSINYDGTVFDVSHVRREKYYKELYNGEDDPGIIAFLEEQKNKEKRRLQEEIASARKKLAELEGPGA